MKRLGPKKVLYGARWTDTLRFGIYLVLSIIQIWRLLRSIVGMQDLTCHSLKVQDEKSHKQRSCCDQTAFIRLVVEEHHLGLFAIILEMSPMKILKKRKLKTKGFFFVKKNTFVHCDYNPNQIFSSCEPASNMNIFVILEQEFGILDCI